eukprot:NODE_17289_length_951_cov_4.257282.p1 GENE.NODE_17289_length_951_cov_4.257282~~NODE_17289_length_951_cov_4.257282.p1  ORF type:complete len:223 (+),score=51.82 NODE_17289_length_951_cov_4.257282:43-669(+)
MFFLRRVAARLRTQPLANAAPAAVAIATAAGALAGQAACSSGDATVAKSRIAALRQRAAYQKPGFPRVSGFNHLAYHFFDIGGGCCLASFWFGEQVPCTPGVATVDHEAKRNGKGMAVANGGMNHVAFNVDTYEELKRWKAHLESAGVAVSGIVIHVDNPEGDPEFHSIYFEGPDGEFLEFSYQERRDFTPERDVTHLPKTAAEARFR